MKHPKESIVSGRPLPGSVRDLRERTIVRPDPGDDRPLIGTRPNAKLIARKSPSQAVRGSRQGTKLVGRKIASVEFT